MRDYKKGKYLLENRPGQLLPVGNTKDNADAGIAEQQQRRVLDKVWNTVEKAMGEMRNILISQLQDPTRSVEEQEKTIEWALFPRWVWIVFPPSDLCIFQGAGGAAIQRRSCLDVL